MKKLLLSFALLCAVSFVAAQNQPAPKGVPSQQYDSLKAAGALSSGLYFIDQNQTTVPLSNIVQPSPSPQAQAAACECVIQLDATFQVVPFQFGQGPDYRNDDFSSNAINLPFNFCLYGQTQSTVYINNNGNISFGAPYGTFSGVAFPSANYTMIAPFWADVDTRDPASGLVYYKLTPTALIVRWQTVGYYSQHADKLNDFQLIITDGSDPILPIGTNCAFCYGDMQWTTGDASGGTNGFGGTAATVGCNLGDGVNFIQIGRFDQPGTLYNGPFGPPSQVSWLDNLSLFFDVCNIGTGGNIPPLMNSTMICDTFDLCVGDTMQLQAFFLSPENTQLTTASASTTSTGLTNVGGPPANPVNLNAYFVGLQSNLGINTILITGTDNGTPPLSAMGQIFINVIQGPTAAITSTGACPGDSVMFGTTGTTTVNGPIVQYHWDFGMTSLTNDTSNIDSSGYVYPNSGTYTVYVEVTDSLGCSDTAQRQIVVYELPDVAFTGTPLTGCSPLCVNFTDQSTVLNSTVVAWNWSFGDGQYSTLQTPSNCYYDQGSYSVELVVTSAEGCKDSLTITNMATVIPGPVAGFTFGPQPATMSEPTITFIDMSTNGTVEWFWAFGDNGTSTDPNPVWVYQDTGTFTVMQIVSGPGGACPDTAFADVIISPELLIWIPNAFTPNGNGNDDRFMPVFSDASYVKNYSMTIFDRWGQMIFQTNDPYTGWDGRIGNQTVQVDTYVYKIHVEDLNGLGSDYIGGFSLIK